MWSDRKGRRPMKKFFTKDSPYVGSTPSTTLVLIVFKLRSKHTKNGVAVSAAGRRGAKITAPVRALLAAVRKSKTLAGLLIEGDIDTIKKRLGYAPSPKPVQGSAGDWRRQREKILASGKLAKTRTVHIVATPHTMFVAHAFAKSIESCDLTVHISDEMPDHFSSDLYIVICPQMFKKLPPREKRIAMQMEQAVSSRWFTDDYISRLRESLAVFDYSARNLAFLASHGISYPQTFHVPLGAINFYSDWLASRGLDRGDTGEGCEVLFYGDVHNARRQFILDKVGQHFNTRIISDSFGAELRKAVRGAKVVLNVHYYEGALLEVPRIYECLSLGAHVISEEGSDQEHHKELESLVSFVPVNDWQAIVDKIDQVLKASPAATGQERRDANWTRFNFMLCRALFALGIITFKQLENRTRDFTIDADAIVVSMPETIERRMHAVAEKAADVAIFDGLRAWPGWVGTAYGYKYLARKLLARGAERVLIYEDDADFPLDFETSKKSIEAYLRDHDGEWDMFAGLISDLHPDTNILHAEERDDLTFVTLDRTVSMIYNIFGKRALEFMSEWEDVDRNLMTGTIDRFIEKHTDLRVVTTLPFVVGHSDKLCSTLWASKSNKDCAAMIAASMRRLDDKVSEYRARALTVKPETGPIRP